MPRTVFFFFLPPFSFDGLELYPKIFDVLEYFIFFFKFTLLKNTP